VSLGKFFAASLGMDAMHYKSPVCNPAPQPIRPQPELRKQHSPEGPSMVSLTGGSCTSSRVSVTDDPPDAVISLTRRAGDTAQGLFKLLFSSPSLPIQPGVINSGLRSSSFFSRRQGQHSRLNGRQPDRWIETRGRAAAQRPHPQAHTNRCELREKSSPLETSMG
jgi:hypothetical protein